MSEAIPAAGSDPDTKRRNEKIRAAAMASDPDSKRRLEKMLGADEADKDEDEDKGERVKSSRAAQPTKVQGRQTAQGSTHA